MDQRALGMHNGPDCRDLIELISYQQMQQPKKSVASLCVSQPAQITNFNDPKMFGIQNHAYFSISKNTRIFATQTPSCVYFKSSSMTACTYEHAIS